MKRQLITVIGASCSGKTTFLEKMVNEYGFASLVSTTTRPKRTGEVEGESYYYVSVDAFKALAEQNGFIEAMSFSGHHYGATKEEVLRKSQNGAPILKIVEPSGIAPYRKFAEDNDWDFKSIFIDIDLDAAITRMLERDRNMPNFEERLNSLKNIEMTWRNLDYDIVIPSYNKDNDVFVCDEIAEQLSCESISAASRF